MLPDEDEDERVRRPRDDHTSDRSFMQRDENMTTHIVILQLVWGRPKEIVRGLIVSGRASERPGSRREGARPGVFFHRVPSCINVAEFAADVASAAYRGKRSCLVRVI